MMPQSRRPTMPDVARVAGVSIKTVSRVINDEPAVRPETAERVLSAIKELGFRRNDIARRLRSGHATSTLGLVIADLGNPFYSVIARAVEEVAREHGSLLVTGSSEESPERARELLLELLARRVDGLLVVAPPGGEMRYLREEIERGTPVVLLDRPVRGVRADTVLLDNVGGARCAVQHLVEGGNRRIALLVEVAELPTMRDRLAGAQEALNRGSSVSAEVVSELHTPEHAAAALRRLLDGPSPPTGVFCANNRITVGVIEELHRRGVQLDVVGFDDFELAHLLPMPFHVVAYDTAEIGRMAANLLFQRLDGDQSRPRRIVLPTTLVPRGVGA